MLPLHHDAGPHLSPTLRSRRSISVIFVLEELTVSASQESLRPAGQDATAVV